MKRTLSMVLILMFLAGCVGTVATDRQVLKSEYRGVVSITTVQGAGSGFVIAEDKEYYYISTAAHVVDNGANLPVSAPMVNGVVGTVIAYGDADTENDVAIIRVKRFNRRYKVYSLAKTKQEARVKAVGFLYVNLMDEPLFSIYIGHVVNLNWQGFITMNGGVYPGMSGGPLLDQWGRVVGITSRCPTMWGIPAETSAMFVPASRLQTMLDELDL